MLVGIAWRAASVGKLMPPDDEKWICGDEEGVGPLAHKSCEGRIDLAAGAGVEDLDLQPDGASSSFHVSHVASAVQIGRIDEHGNASCSRHQLAQEFQPLCRQLAAEKD